MKNNNTLYTPVALILCLLLVGSCNDDLLNINNPNTLSTNNFYRDADDASAALNAAYANLQKDGLYLYAFPMIADQRSDEATFTGNATGFGDQVQVVNFTAPADGLRFAFFPWEDGYEGVLRANAVLAKVPDIEMDEALKDRILAEAQFLRALYYFHIITLYGEIIPIITDFPEGNEDLIPPTASTGQVWALIEEDLKAAQSVLPTKEDDRYELGHASKGSATGYLGKAYLYQEKWPEAAAEFKKIIDGEVGNYRLMQNYRDNFTEANENNDESLFEVQFDIAPGDDRWSRPKRDLDGAMEGNWLPQNRGVRAGNGRRWWNEMATEKLANTYESGDPRKFMTLWVPEGAYYTDLDGQVKDFQAMGWQEGEFGFRKYEYDVSSGLRRSGINIRLLRYADVLLMYAEALANGASTGGTPEEYINQVRSRAQNRVPDEQPHLFYANAPASLPTVEELMAQQGWDIMEAIRHERMVELGGEFVRYFDLIRWGQAVADANITDPNFRYGVNHILPIPQQELNTNPNMVPNSAN